MESDTSFSKNEKNCVGLDKALCAYIQAKYNEINVDIDRLKTLRVELDSYKESTLDSIDNKKNYDNLSLEFNNLRLSIESKTRRLVDMVTNSDIDNSSNNESYLSNIKESFDKLLKEIGL